MARWDIFVNLTNSLKKILISSSFILLLSACGAQSEIDQGFTTIEFEPIPEMQIEEEYIEESTSITSTGSDTESDYILVPGLQEVVAEESEVKSEAESIVDAMSLEEKIYQLFIVFPEQLTGEACVTGSGNGFKEALDKYPVGGIIFLSQNIVDPNQTIDMLENMQKCALELEGIPLFLCVDEEGGTVTRVARNVSFGVNNVGDMINVVNETEAYDIGNYIGQYLSELGFNVDFAPVVDVITNERNVVVKKRSFGSDPQKVVSFASEYSKGLHDSGVLSTFKHFPGHGATEADTHEGFAYTEKTYADMLEIELLPFSEAQEQGVDFVMVSHISVPRITGNNVPCSLSYKMVTSILKEDMAYDGIVITDAMGMGAISEAYGDVQAVLMAIKAGNDMVLTPGSMQESAEAIMKAVENGEITEESIDSSVMKIIEKKIKLRDSEDN